MSSIPAEYQEALLALLGGLVSADNDTRTQAEKSLHGEWVKAEKVEMLLLFLAEQAAGGQTEEARAFSAVLFRRMALRLPEGTGYSVTARTIDQTGAQVREQIRQVLLAGLTAPQQPRHVRHKLADAVAECAKEECGEWPELLPALLRAAESTDEAFRESAFRVLGATPDVIGGSHVAAALPVFHAGFEDASDDVRISAATAFVAFFQQVPKKSWAQLSTLLPSLLNSLPRLLDNGREAALAALLESLIELVELAPKMFKPMFGTIVEFCSAVAKNGQIEQETRLAALELLVTFSEASPNMCKREAAYTREIVVVTLQLMTEVSVDDDAAEAWNDADDADDADDELEYDAARQSLDRVALRLGGQALAGPLFQYLPAMLASQQWRERHAALMALSSAAEGCRDALMAETPRILDLVLPLLADAHPRVQYGCCNALGQISTDFADVIQKTSGDRIIPALVSKLTAASVPRVQAHAAAALVNFSENASKEVLAPYLDDLLTNLLTLLQGQHRYVQEQVLTTIAIIADAAQATFVKYFDTLMPILVNVLKTDMGKENRLLKAKCIECSTLIASAVGKDKFQPYAGEVIQLFGHIQFEAVDDDDPVRPYLQQGWGRVCRIIGADFVPLLPTVIPPLLAAGKAQQDISLLDESEVDDIGADDNWDVIQLSGKHIAVHTSILDDKVTAIELLKTYADVLLADFYQYVDEIAADIAVPAIDFYLHDGVRGAAALSMPSLLRCTIAATSKSSAQTLALWQKFCDKLTDALLNEPVPELLVAYYSAFISCSELVGENALNGVQLDALAKVVESNLKEIYDRIKARESADDEYAEETEDDDDEFTDEEILDEINKAVSAIFKSAKTAFVAPFGTMVPTVAQYINDDNTAIKLCGLCIVSDLIENTGESSWHFKDLFLNQLGDSLTSPQASIRQVAAYAVGVAAQYGGPAYLPFAIATLDPIFKMSTVVDAKAEENITATENGTTAIAKICHSYGSNLPGLDQIIETWFKLLPVVKDDEAAPYSYGFLAELIGRKHPVVMQQVPKVVDNVVQALVYGSISGKTASRVVDATKTLLNTIPQQDAMAIFSKYPTDTQIVAQKWFA